MTIMLGIFAALAALVALGALIALPAIAIAHFGKTDYVSAGVTAHEVDHTIWTLYGMGGETETATTGFSIDQFMTPDAPQENAIIRAIKEHEFRLGREE